MNTPYLVSLFIHILSAITFVGGMIFLTLVLMPVMRRPDVEEHAGMVMTAAAKLFGRVGAVSVVLLIVTGFTNAMFKGFGTTVFSPEFWRAPYAHIMGTKLILAVIIAGLGMLHSGKSGEKALSAMKEAPDAIDTRAKRRRASWTGRISFLLSLIAVLLGIMMSRGFLP